MADTLQIAAGRKASMARLPYRSLGYCTDAEELWIGGQSGNVRLAAAELFDRLTAAESAAGALTQRVSTLETALNNETAARQGLASALSDEVAARQQLAVLLNAETQARQQLAADLQALTARVKALEDGGKT